MPGCHVTGSCCGREAYKESFAKAISFLKVREVVLGQSHYVEWGGRNGAKATLPSRMGSSRELSSWVSVPVRERITQAGLACDSPLEELSDHESGRKFLPQSHIRE